jgi:hypothetical protein
VIDPRLIPLLDLMACAIAEELLHEAPDVLADPPANAVWAAVPAREAASP